MSNFKNIKLVFIVIFMAKGVICFAQNTNYKSFKNYHINYELFTNNDSTYGYNILINGKVFISQNHIPAVSGNVGFKSKIQAEKTARLVVSKLQKNRNALPSVTISELDSLGIKY